MLSTTLPPPLGMTNRTKPVLYPTIQHVVIILYTKYELSILHSCGNIFDEKCREKEKMDKYREEQTGESWFSIPQCNKSFLISYKTLTFYLKRLLRNLLRKLTVLAAWKETKNEQIYGRTNMTKLVLYPMIQLVVVVLYPKYEISILYSCGDIFNEK